MTLSENLMLYAADLAEDAEELEIEAASVAGLSQLVANGATALETTEQVTADLAAAVAANLTLTDQNTDLQAQVAGVTEDLVAAETEVSALTALNDTLELDLSAVTAARDTLLGTVDDLNAQVDVLEAANTTLQTELAAQIDQAATLAALVADLQAQLEACEGEPSPSETRVMEADGPDGRGGWNGGCFFDDGTGLFPSDVGGLAHTDETGRAHKCNVGIPEAHVAGVWKLNGHQALVITGTVGPSERSIRVFDTETHECGSSITSGITVRSQNSAGWGDSIGASDVRSCGLILYMRANGDIVVGSFKDGVKIYRESTGTVHTLPGSEGWECRSLVNDPEDDAKFYVGTWSNGGKKVTLDGTGIAGAIVDAFPVAAFPHVEHIAVGESFQVAACMDDGIFLRQNGVSTDITANAPRSAWWTFAMIQPNGDIFASCARPDLMDGEPCSVIFRPAGSTQWINLTTFPIDMHDLSTGNLYWGFDDAPSKCLGGSGAVVNELAMTPDGRLCAIGASGVLWFFDFVTSSWTVSSKGMGIISFRDMAANEDGSIIAWACMDYRCLVSYDGGATYRNPGGDSGSNDGQRVEIVGDTLYLSVDSGEKFTLNLTNPTANFQSFGGTMPANQPETRAVRSGAILTLDGEDISDPMLARFGLGDIGGMLSVGDDVWIWGHGCLRSHMVSA